VLNWELLPGRMRLLLEIEGRTIIAERPLPELPFSPRKVPKKVGIKVVSYSTIIQ
jgi:thiamine transport system ATP-binding protein